jgi:hypothetical protein
MSDDLSLFGVEALRVTPVAPGADPAPKLSGGRRLVLRQHNDIRAGRNPLTGGPLHLEAAAVAAELPTLEAFVDGANYQTPEQPAPGRRCGNCRFRRGTNAGTAHDFPKCWHGWDGVPGHAPPRRTGGPASDVRAFWPACRDHEYPDPGQETND